MRAVRVARTDGPDGIEVAEVEDPRAGPGQVVIEVRAAGVNFPDLLLSRGEYQLRPEPPFLLGSEVSGEVVSVGEGVPLEEGAQVVAVTELGGFAERVAADANLVFDMPKELSFEAAAALPMNYLTVHFALLRRGRLKAGETLLVHGGGGGIGTAATQLANALGSRVLAVASNEEKASVATAAGADEILPVEGFRDEARRLTAGRGVDVVLDPVGGERFTDSLRSLSVEGRLIVVGFASGEIPVVKVNRLLFNNLDVIGAGWGAFLAHDAAYVRQQWEEMRPMVGDGRLSPLVGATFPLEKAADALREIGERRATGKVVLRAG